MKKVVLFALLFAAAAIVRQRRREAARRRTDRSTTATTTTPRSGAGTLASSQLRRLSDRHDPELRGIEYYDGLCTPTGLPRTARSPSPSRSNRSYGAS